jgi:uncharacterized protein
MLRGLSEERTLIPQPPVADRPEPIAMSSRALGPDLARGCMLLFIALANSHYFLQGDEVLGGYPQNGSAVDSLVTWTLSTFVDGRAFPMFGFLFGYGVARIAARNEPLGARKVRHLLWRRSLVLIIVGFLHAVLLYVGDILTAYGVLLFFGALLVRRRARWLVVIAVLLFSLNALPGDDSSTISRDQPHVTMLPPNVDTMLTERPIVSVVIGLLGPLGFMCPFAIGMLAGRKRVLEEPERHRKLLGFTAVLGIGVAVLGAQPIALMLSGVLSQPDDAVLHRIGPLHDATGVLGGLGYASLIALLSIRLQSRSSRIISALSATGQRSMTCYLAQSVMWSVAFTPFLLDLSDDLTVATTALLATCTWLTTVALADWMRRSGRRGPFEALIRRVTYDPRWSTSRP